MLDVLHSRFKELERQRHSLLAEMLAHTPSQLAFSPEPGSWSLAVLLQHLVLVEEGTLKFLTLKTPRPASDRTLAHRLRWTAVRILIPHPIRIRAPNPLVVPTGEVPVEVLVARWEAVRGALKIHLEKISAPQLELLVFKHPIAGPIPIAETLEFLALHLTHHRHQIRRIRRAPGWPHAVAPTARPASATA